MHSYILDNGPAVRTTGFNFRILPQALVLVIWFHFLTLHLRHM